MSYIYGWIYGNNVAIAGFVKNDYDFFFYLSIWIVLGGKLQTTTKKPIDNEGFRGYVSQLNIYSRSLSFTTEIPEIYTNPRQIFDNTILRWNEFVLYKGVQPSYPSKASRYGCATGTNCVKNGMIALKNYHGTKYV